MSCTKSSCDIVVKSAMPGQTGRESGMGRTKGSGSARREAPGAKAAERATQALLVLFGENFYQARVQAGLTQIDIEAHGIKQAYISQIEGGRENPTLATLTILALAVGEDVRARMVDSLFNLTIIIASPGRVVVVSSTRNSFASTAAA